MLCDALLFLFLFEWFAFSTSTDKVDLGSFRSLLDRGNDKQQEYTETTRGNKHPRGHVRRQQVSKHPPAAISSGHREMQEPSSLSLIEIIAQTFVLQLLEAYIGFGLVAEEISQNPGPMAMTGGTI